MAYPALDINGSIVVGVGEGSSVEFKPRVLKAPFGNGYVQRAGDGYNANPATFNVKFSNLTRPEAESIMTFLSGRAGYLPFQFKIPGETGYRQWICETWAKNFKEGLITDITATFTENFDA